jgi:hypothetical protein
VDLHAAIQSLRAELARVDQTISALEDLKEGAGAPDAKPHLKRGRKAMNREERQEVSARMRRYWAQRREAKVG